jgi:hypothetical protein
MKPKSSATVKASDLGDNEICLPLVKYFGGAFFHDGVIDGIHFSSDCKDVVLRVSSPNIKITIEGDFQFAPPVWFKCYFQRVSLFDMRSEKLNKYNDPFGPLEHCVKVDETTLNSLKSDISYFNKKNKSNNYSIEISTIPNTRVIRMVFEDCFVDPEEPMAFELLKNFKNVQIPFGQ